MHAEPKEPANHPEGDLLAQWRKGDQAAAAELFRRYSGRLIALARSRIRGNMAHRIDQSRKWYSPATA